MLNVYALLKKPFSGRYQVPWQWPRNIEQSHTWDPVGFISRTGAHIKGLFHQTPATLRKGVIVCAHPMGTAAKGFFLRYGHADLLLKHGYDVLLFDFNGFGESGNGNFDYPLDVIAAGDYAARRTQDPRIGLLGCSFGAGWSLCAVALSDHPFKAVVAEGPFTTLAEYWCRYRVPCITLRILTFIMPRLAQRIKPIDRIREASDSHVLLIYGEQDDKTPIGMGERLQQRSAVPTTLWKVPNAKHNYAFMSTPDVYTERIIGHFDQYIALTQE